MRAMDFQSIGGTKSQSNSCKFENQHHFEPAKMCRCQEICSSVDGQDGFGHRKEITSMVIEDDIVNAQIVELNERDLAFIFVIEEIKIDRHKTEQTIGKEITAVSQRATPVASLSSNRRECSRCAIVDLMAKGPANSSDKQIRPRIARYSRVAVDSFVW